MIKICRQCRWWIRKYKRDIGTNKLESTNFGDCHGSTPLIVGRKDANYGTTGIATFWPATSDNEIACRYGEPSND